MSKLENFKYIDDKKIINKYEITQIIDTSNTLDNHYRNTLKDYSPEKEHRETMVEICYVSLLYSQLS